MPKRLHHDFESYSDLDLRKVGSDNYARHPSTEVLMCAYAIDAGPVKQWVPVEGQPMPAELEDAVCDERVLKLAWNKPFEWAIWKHVEGVEIPHEQWRDPMVLALSLSLPGALEKVGPILGLSEEYLKHDTGQNLINWFCKPRKATKKRPAGQVHWWQEPKRWETFLAYNRADVEAERKVWLNLSPYDLSPEEWQLWFLDQKINQRGIPINLRMAENAIAIREDLIEMRMEELRKLTGLANPNSSQQFLPWLQEQGYIFDDLKAGHVRRAVELYDPHVHGKALKRALELRLEISRTSTKKYAAYVAHADHEAGVIRNCFQFAGAGRTNRWAGRTAQVHNLAKPVPGLDGLDWSQTEGGWQKITGGTQILAAQHIETLDALGLDLLYANPIDVLSGGVRTVIQAPDGYVFVDADLRAIENVVLGYLADDDRILRVFRDGLDPYIDFATHLYGQPYADLWTEYKAGDKRKRTVAKPGVLGCLGPNTEVLTDRGWTPITEVRPAWHVHDGIGYVPHGGVVAQGEREVISLDGILITSDHEVFEGDGFVRADRVDLRRAGAAAIGRMLPPKTRPETRRAVAACPTFDILDAGPRARFMIRGRTGIYLGHNCGYMLGAGKTWENKKTGEIEATGLLGYAWNMGVKLTPEEAALSVKVWRETYRQAVEFWWAIERAAKKCLRTGRATTCGPIGFDRKGPFLRMRLPSQRHLHYVRPKIEDVVKPWGDIGEAITYEGLDERSQWGRISTHPGKLVENCFGADTLILTGCGPKRIVDVASDDLVWDGAAFVRHSGVVCSGVRETVGFGGVRVTPEHRVWTDDGWREIRATSFAEAASACARHYGLPQWNAGCGSLAGWGRKGLYLGGPLRLRRGEADGSVRASEGQAEIMRVLARALHRGSATHARHVEASRVCCLALHGGSLHAADASGMAQLRRAGRHSLPGVADLLRDVLARHGADLHAGLVDRASGQRAGIQTGQLRVGHSETAGAEQAGHSADRHAARAHDGAGGGGSERHRGDHDPLSRDERLPNRTIVRSARCAEQVYAGPPDRHPGRSDDPYGSCSAQRDQLQHAEESGGSGLAGRSVVRPARTVASVEPTYDLVDCGPSHRFMVLAPGGAFIAHNCDQATARDILAHGMRLAERRGVPVVMHVHDQIVGLAREDDADRQLRVLTESMAERPPWAPDLPLHAAGHISKHFVKD